MPYIHESTLYHNINKSNSRDLEFNVCKQKRCIQTFTFTVRHAHLRQNHLFMLCLHTKQRAEKTCLLTNPLASKTTPENCLTVSRCRHAQHVFLVRSGKNHSEVSREQLTHLKITFPFVKFSFSSWWHFSPGDSCQNGYELGLFSRKHIKYSNFVNGMLQIYFSYLHFSLYSCISTLVRQFHP